MARTFTVAALVTRASQRADAENDSHISNSEWKGLLSSAYGELVGEVTKCGMRHFEAEDTIVTDGNSEYALPSGYLATVGVDYEIDSGGTRRPLYEAMAQERNLYSGSTGNTAVAYAIIGTNIRLYPTPASSQTYYHVYTQQPTDLSAATDGTSVDVIAPAGEEFIVWLMVAKAKAKASEDTRDAERNVERYREHIMEFAVLRALNEGRRPTSDHLAAGYVPGDWWIG